MTTNFPHYAHKVDANDAFSLAVAYHNFCQSDYSSLEQCQSRKYWARRLRELIASTKVGDLMSDFTLENAIRVSDLCISQFK